MRDRQEYEFWIDAFSPKDMPMQRLGEYMARFGQLLGEKDSVHFRELREGSTGLIVEVEWEAIPKIIDQIESLKSGEAAMDVIYAQDQINAMLREDNAVGEFRRLTNGQHEPILRFPGLPLRAMELGRYRERRKYYWL